MLQENYTLTQANQMLHERITMLLKRATSASDSSKVNKMLDRRMLLSVNALHHTCCVRY